MIELEPVIPENRMQTEQLTVAAGQETYIETVSECLSEADERSEWHPMRILEDGEPVGFTMYGFFGEECGGRLWFDRLLIDRRWQHRGLGRRAIRVILEQMRREFPPQDIYLSVYDDNPRAIELYLAYGFAFSGELDLHGEKIMVLPKNASLPHLQDRKAH